MAERITATIADFMEMSGLNRAQVALLRHEQRIKTIKVGKRVMVVLDSYRELCGLPLHTPPHTINGNNSTIPAYNEHIRRPRKLLNRRDRRTISIG